MESGNQSNGTVLDVVRVSNEFFRSNHFVLVLHRFDIVKESEDFSIEFFARSLVDLLKQTRTSVVWNHECSFHNLDESKCFVHHVGNILSRIGVKRQVVE